jgi:hypothetical protein
MDYRQGISGEGDALLLASGKFCKKPIVLEPFQKTDINEGHGIFPLSVGRCCVSTIRLIMN